jgi:AcrR family transcriptional regulator
MREAGTTDVRFTDIARVMGMTPPALYRYYADRDELLTDLITDSYAHLGATVAAARDRVDPDDIGARWLAAATAYREWARNEPQRFALVLGLPVPGYAAPDEGPTTEAAKDAMSQLAALFVAAAQSGQLREPLVGDAWDAVAACAHEKHPELDGIVPAESFQAMLQAWSALHGFTSLEAYGHLDWFEPEARDALFLSHVRMIALAAGIPAPS